MSADQAPQTAGLTYSSTFNHPLSGSLMPPASLSALADLLGQVV